jgi:hypothetical protein
MARDPAALQLRLLQTVVEVAAERNSTLVMPVPVELLRFFDRMAPGQGQAEPAPPLEDIGDAEVAEAEAEIGESPTAALPIPDIPPVPEIAPPPDEALKLPEDLTAEGDGILATPATPGAPAHGEAEGAPE